VPVVCAGFLSFDMCVGSRSDSRAQSRERQVGLWLTGPAPLPLDDSGRRSVKNNATTSESAFDGRRPVYVTRRRAAAHGTFGQPATAASAMLRAPSSHQRRAHSKHVVTDRHALWIPRRTVATAAESPHPCLRGCRFRERVSHERLRTSRRWMSAFAECAIPERRAVPSARRVLWPTTGFRSIKG